MPGGQVHAERVECEPDGTRLTFQYDNPGGANATRLRAVTSNRGYALLLHGCERVAWRQVGEARAGAAAQARSSPSLAPAEVPV